tara:strand:- start:305 stop:526 length:222 start_codon:yes stop_codon:yes gene_type:complete
MKPDEVRELTNEDIQEKVTALKKQLFDVRVQVRLGQVQKGHELKKIRRDIARFLTIQQERGNQSAPVQEQVAP